MLELYFWTTDNGHKARMMVEETGLDHVIKPINLRKKEQFSDAFLKINPSHKIPAIVDPDAPGGKPVTLFETGAILKYLANKAAPALYPDDQDVEKWFFWGTSTFTPLAQQFGHFTHRSPEKVPAAQAHYEEVLKDLLSIMDGRLAEAEYLGGDAYTIADTSCYPDVHLHGVDDVGLDAYPNLARWHAAIEARPATQRAWGPYE